MWNKGKTIKKNVQISRVARKQSCWLILCNSFNSDDREIYDGENYSFWWRSLPAARSWRHPMILYAVLPQCKTTRSEHVIGIPLVLAAHESWLSKRRFMSCYRNQITCGQGSEIWVRDYLSLSRWIIGWKIPWAFIRAMDTQWNLISCGYLDLVWLVRIWGNLCSKRRKYRRVIVRGPRRRAINIFSLKRSLVCGWKWKSLGVDLLEVWQQFSFDTTRPLLSARYP